MPPKFLAEALANITQAEHPDLLVGFNKADDAGVYRIGRDTALVQSVNFFPPIVDDPFQFGQITAANSVEYGLTTSIFTQDIDFIMRFIDEVETGMVHVNEPTIGGEAQLPFGGVKATGVGDREMAEEGLNFFTEIKTVFINYSGRAERLMIR